MEIYFLRAHVSIFAPGPQNLRTGPVNKFISTLSIVGISIGKTIFEEEDETPARIDSHSPATFARSDVLSSSPIRMMLLIFFGSILVEVSFLQIRS
jgi:hypothetical protein